MHQNMERAFDRCDQGNSVGEVILIHCSPKRGQCWRVRRLWSKDVFDFMQSTPVAGRESVLLSLDVLRYACQLLK